MRLALAQLRARPGDPTANLATAEQACGCARDLGADLIVFPELWQIGYAPGPADGPAQNRWLGQAEDLDGSWITAFRRIAADRELAILTTFLRRGEQAPRDCAAVIDASGTVALVQDKVHLCDLTWERELEPGQGFDAATVATRSGPIRLGVMICFDREFPESARELALDGAELIVSPNACLLCDDRLGQLRCRAFENMVAVGLANYPRPVMNGRSCVFDGVAVAGNRPRDHTVYVADAAPGLRLVDIDVDGLRRYRDTGLWKPDRRRPLAYRRLTAEPASRSGS